MTITDTGRRAALRRRDVTSRFYTVTHDSVATFLFADIAGFTALTEAHAVLRVTRRQRWVANTLAGLAEIALLRHDVERATALLEDARDRYASRSDLYGVAAVEERLAELQRSR